jgi:dTDP-4-amino-4,6-dideoxygalactose transaminase
MIRVSEPRFGPETEALVLEVVRSGQVAQGPLVARLEALGAEMAGARHAVAVSNGTVSLETAFEVLGVGPGDEVITSPFTFAATINAILRTGATVRFADIGSDFTVRPEAVASLIGPRTKAVVPVHLYGLMADMGPIMALAAEHGLAVVEDAAQAHGASIDGRRAGSFGIGSFSFYATKNVAAGEGGLLTTSDDDLARRFRLLRNQGMVERYRYETVGRNLRMTDLQAALAVPQMERLAEINAARSAHADELTKRLQGVPGLVLPAIPPGREHVWHQYTVLLPPGRDRGQVQEKMREAGVDSGVYYPRLAWDYPVYRDHPGVAPDDTPTARAVAGRCLSLPVHPGLGAEEIEQVAEALLTSLEATL